MTDPSGRSRAGLAKGDGKDDDTPTGDELLGIFKTHQDQAIVDDADHQGADDPELLHRNGKKGLDIRLQRLKLASKASFS